MQEDLGFRESLLPSTRVNTREEVPERSNPVEQRLAGRRLPLRGAVSPAPGP
jgi:hypothetical protein